MSLQEDWKKIKRYVQETFGIENPQIHDILWLIALNEKGEFIERKISRNEKMKWINYGLLVLLAREGYADIATEKLLRPLPSLPITEQNEKMYQMITNYFKENKVGFD